MTAAGDQLTLGPVLFHWSPEGWRDFYYAIADESPVDAVYIGEVVCSKRSPFIEPYYTAVAERLARAGKHVVFASLAEVMIKRERSMTARLAQARDHLVEANDSAGLYHLRGQPHAVGPFLNVYNEASLAALAERGTRHVTLPAELPGTSLATLAQAAARLGVTTEVQVYGRIPLALSARCYHARAHGRVKDNCRFVCLQDPDGMTLQTMAEQPFLAVNGHQTLSHACLNLAGEIRAMQEMGIMAFRISPHSENMLAVLAIYRAVIDGSMAPAEATAKLRSCGLQVPFCNGFFHNQEGHRWIPAHAS